MWRTGSKNQWGKRRKELIDVFRWKKFSSEFEVRKRHSFSFYLKDEFVLFSFPKKSPSSWANLYFPSFLIFLPTFFTCLFSYFFRDRKWLKWEEQREREREERKEEKEWRRWNSVSIKIESRAGSDQDVYTFFRPWLFFFLSFSLWIPSSFFHLLKPSLKKELSPFWWWKKKERERKRVREIKWSVIKWIFKKSFCIKNPFTQVFSI